MPVYTYRCENCGVQFDALQRYEDKPLVRCPECEHESLRKVYLPVGIVFKGKGFYATDHRSPSGQASPKKADKADGNDKGVADTSGKPSDDK